MNKLRLTRVKTAFTILLAITIMTAAAIFPRVTANAAVTNTMLRLSQTSFNVKVGDIWSTKVTVSNTGSGTICDIEFLQPADDGSVIVFPPDGGFPSSLGSGGIFDIYLRFDSSAAVANSALTYTLKVKYCDADLPVSDRYEFTQDFKITVGYESETIVISTPSPDPTPAPLPNTPNVLQTSPFYYVAGVPEVSKKIVVTIVNDAKVEAANEIGRAHV